MEHDGIKLNLSVFLPINKNFITLIDEEDLKKVSKFNWFAHRFIVRGKITYRPRCTKNSAKYRYIYQLIMDAKNIDHINGNTLDNRKINLRKCDQSQNMANRGPQKNNTSGYKGVYFDKSKKKFKAQIKLKQKPIFIGRYKTSIEAAQAYDKKAKELFGEFAYLNFKT